jgi:hypothetical protein
MTAIAAGASRVLPLKMDGHHQATNELQARGLEICIRIRPTDHAIQHRVRSAEGAD